ncbi:rhodanese-like domain-containing protein [Natrialbaceae archaeon A-CW2]|uniref:rhodanese-like domain-containing protein n=1 Tax=Natronosalvus amylolyticus TaxID=2961994 RepID=UPI0020C9DC58|nr:rhodanese-like domain-containing protein [Natronosalvus amylolyticus]
MATITPSRFDEKRDSSDPFVLDIRPTDSFEREHIEGSYNVPVYSDLQRGNEDSFRRRLDEIPGDRPVVVVCKAGIVARKATAILDDEGHESMTLLGGMGAWNGYQKNSLGYKIRSLVWKLTR